MVIDIGIKECSKCEYNLKCSECACKHISDNLSKILRDKQKRTLREVGKRLKAEFSKITVTRDIHDEEECDMDSDEVWAVLDRVTSEIAEADV